MDTDRAEEIGVAGLIFLAADIQRLGRFLALTGLGPAELKAEARTPRMLAAVLDHLLHDESLLLVFAADNQLEPEDIAPARRLLALQAGERHDP
jgi:hypothetical protein